MMIDYDDLLFIIYYLYYYNKYKEEMTNGRM